MTPKTITILLLSFISLPFLIIKTTTYLKNSSNEIFPERTPREYLLTNGCDTIHFYSVDKYSIYQLFDSKDWHIVGDPTPEDIHIIRYEEFGDCCLIK